ncbi:hypothetical protein STEG23_022850 [Scotinomys teguina]
MVDELVLLLHALLVRHRALIIENNQLMEQLRWLVCERATLLRKVRPPSCPVPFPSRFNGESARLPEFIVQTTSYMLVNEDRFCNDAMKVAFLISLLTGEAEEWVLPYFELDNHLLCNYPAFVEELKQCFGWYDEEDDFYFEEDDY